MQLQDTNQSHVHAEVRRHTTSPALCVPLLFIAACCGRRRRRGGEERWRVAAVRRRGARADLQNHDQHICASWPVVMV